MFDSPAQCLLTHIIFSRLDCCSSVLTCITFEQIAQLPKTPDHAVWLISPRKHHGHAMPLLTKPHWLPVVEDIVWKLEALSFCCFFDGNLPPYLSCCVSSNSPSRSLRSSSKKLLTVPCVSLVLVHDAFSIRLRTLAWKSLPFKISISSSFSSAKSLLKTHPFAFVKVFQLCKLTESKLILWLQCNGEIVAESVWCVI